MSEVTEVMHKILEFAACTNSAIEIKVETFEGEVHSIRTVIAPTEEKEETIDFRRIDDALIDLRFADHYIGDQLGLNKAQGYQYLVSAMRTLESMLSQYNEDEED